MTKAIAGPFRAEFGAVYHEELAGHVFTVDPARCAEGVANALNAEKHTSALLAALEGLLTDLGEDDGESYQAARLAVANALGVPN